LIVNADTVLAFAVATERLETIPWQGCKVFERRCCLQAIELQAGGALESRERLDSFARGEVSGPLIPVADDHRLKIQQITCYVKHNESALSTRPAHRPYQKPQRRRRRNYVQRHDGQHWLPAGKNLKDSRDCINSK
jgi:hypothetical protein